jgi:hypothetical protein
MKSITLITLLLIAGIAFGEEKPQPLTIGKITPKATSVEEGKGKPPLKIGKIVPREQEKPKIAPEKPRFPKHWGHPPKLQTRDMVKLPASFGRGSSTLAHWIKDNLKRDANKGKPDTGGPDPKPKPPVKPKPQPRPEPPTELKEKMDSYKESQQSLQNGLREKIKALGKKPSREEVRKTVEQFRADNKDLIESQKEIGKSIQDWQKENRPARPKKPEPTAEVKEKLQQVRAKQKELDVVKKAFHEKLKNSTELSKEQRIDLIKEFKQANADKHKAVKAAQKELQKEIRETKQDGPRRK